MRAFQIAAVAVVLLAVIHTGCRSESVQEACVRRTSEYCAQRGGCSEFLRAMETRACVAEATVAGRRG